MSIPLYMLHVARKGILNIVVSTVNNDLKYSTNNNSGSRCFLLPCMLLKRTYRVKDSLLLGVWTAWLGRDSLSRRSSLGFGLAPKL